jgi:hypothetical protein
MKMVYEVKDRERLPPTDDPFGFSSGEPLTENKNAWHLCLSLSPMI